MFLGVSDFGGTSGTVSSSRIDCAAGSSSTLCQRRDSFEFPSFAFLRAYRRNSFAILCMLYEPGILREKSPNWITSVPLSIFSDWKRLLVEAASAQLFLRRSAAVSAPALCAGVLNSSSSNSSHCTSNRQQD